MDLNNYFEGGTALHHIISRDSLAKLGRALNVAMVANVDEAKTFWQTVQGTVSLEIKQQTNGSINKLLENMPLNIEYGPANPLNDPGTGFDPNTVVGDDGMRILGPVSFHLSKLNDIIQNNSEETLGDDESGELWTAANTALVSAFEAFEYTELDDPYQEQWLEVEVNGETRYFRKGLKNYLEADLVTVLRFNRTAIPDVAEIEEELDEEEPDLDIQAYASVDNIEHFLERHTYEYFTFRESDIKLINSFWPMGTSLQNIQTYTTNTLKFLIKYAQQIDLEDTERISLKNQDVDGVPFSVYIMAGVDYTGEDSFGLNLRTLAPEGNVDAFIADDLRTIGDTINWLRAIEMLTDLEK